MRKFLILLFTLSCMQFAYANMENAANIKIKLSGALKENRYFLCIQSIGCLSVKAAQEGKVYPVLRSFEMDNIYIADAAYNLRLSNQGLPSSCNVTVNTNQSLTISGHIVSEPNGSVYVSNLRCKVS